VLTRSVADCVSKPVSSGVEVVTDGEFSKPGPQGQPGADTGGYAGLEDEVDNHWGMLFEETPFVGSLGASDHGAGLHVRCEFRLASRIRRETTD